MDTTPTPLDKLAPALVALQAELTPVDKSANNPFFKSSYAPLPEVMKALQPLLAKNKLAISQFVTNLNGQSAMTTMLIHESGQILTVEPQPLLLPQPHEEDKWDKEAGKLVRKFIVPTPQDQGSAITYARRYGVMAVLGIVADEDDDGNKSSSYNNRPAYDSSAPKVNNSTKPASEAQLKLIRQLAFEAGEDPATIEEKIAKITTSALASATISKLKGE